MELEHTDDRPRERSDKLATLIERGCLLLGNIEFQIEQHLLMHGTRIDPQTRWFLAQVRDAAGAVAGDARGGVESCRHGGHPVTVMPQADAHPSRTAMAAGSGLGEVDAPGLTPTPGPRSATVAANPLLWRSLAHQGIGAACGVLVGFLVFGDPAGVSSGMELAQSESAHQTSARVVAVAPAPIPSELENVAEPHEAHPADAAAGERAPLLMARMSRPDGDGHPGSREQQEHSFPAEPVAPMRPAATEDMLGLSRSIRAEVQRRLTLTGFDPGAVDGIFGPTTREALRAWQAASALPETGYLDETALTALVERTEDAFLARQAAERTRRTAALESPLPRAAPVSGKHCERAPSGEIVYGQGVKCDFEGLKENIARLFGGKPTNHQEVADAQASGQNKDA